MSLKKSYKIQSTIDSFYTGGKITFSKDEEMIISTAGDSVHLINLNSGEKLFTFTTDDDPITCFTSTPDGKYVITASQSLLLKIWNASTGELVKSFKAHEAPVLVMDCDPTSTVFATGSADSTVKVWDIEKGFCTHNLKGHHGILSALKFHPDTRTIRLVSGSDDSKIRVWNLHSKTTEFIFEGHVSVIRGLDFSNDGNVLISGGRDQVLISWDLITGKMIKTLPIYESIEDLVVVKSDCEKSGLVCTGGESGLVKLWDINTGECNFTQAPEENSNYTINSLIYFTKNQEIVSVTSDQNLLFYSIQNNFTRTKQIAGYNEEILDSIFAGERDNLLAVVTNTEQVRVYDLESPFCDILYGHSEMVMNVTRSVDGKYLISGSKDRTAKIWKLNSETKLFECVATCSGHNETVSAVSMSRKSNSFMITGSNDMTVKLWDICDNDGNITTKTRFTIKAHDKDIQSIHIAPNDRIFATAALDKTAKIWSTADGSLLGTLKGHKRGIWCVRFSSSDQVVATTSTDKTIKLWSLSDFSCIRTFEGHLNSVLHCEFISGGLQLATSGSDGLVKIWTIKSSECVATLDNHEDKIWGLSTNADESRLVSGSADSRITIWRNTTLEEQETAQAELEERIGKEQDLSVFLLKKDYKNAIHLALQLAHPFKLLNILKTVKKQSNEAESILGLKSVDDLIINLQDEQLIKLLFFVRDWNTNANHCDIAQSVLQIVLKNIDMERILSLPKIKEVLETLLPYTERHYDHANELLKQIPEDWNSGNLMEILKQNLIIFQQSLKIDTLIPLGKYALTPGFIYNTNKVTIALSKDWYIECSVFHALQVLERQQQKLQLEMESLNNQKKDDPILHFVDDSGHALNEEGLRFVEIREVYNENDTIAQTQVDSSVPSESENSCNVITSKLNSLQLGDFEVELLKHINDLEMLEQTRNLSMDDDDAHEGEADEDDDDLEFTQISDDENDLQNNASDIDSDSESELEPKQVSSTPFNSLKPKTKKVHFSQEALEKDHNENKQTNQIPSKLSQLKPSDWIPMRDLVVERDDSVIIDPDDLDEYELGKQIALEYARKRNKLQLNELIPSDWKEIERPYENDIVENNIDLENISKVPLVNSGRGLDKFKPKVTQTTGNISRFKASRNKNVDQS